MALRPNHRLHAYPIVTGGGGGCGCGGGGGGGGGIYATSNYKESNLV